MRNGNRQESDRNEKQPSNLLFHEISSSELAVRVEQRGQINRGNRNSDRPRKFAQDTKQEGFRMIVSRNCAYIYVGKFFVSGGICLVSWLKNIVGGCNTALSGAPPLPGWKRRGTYVWNFALEPVINRSGDYFWR
jgi:hypothetical protein